MELMKQHVLVYQRENEAFSQMTLDEDYNVPDSCEDVGRLIQYQGRVQIDEIKVSDARVFVMGHLNFKLLFAVDGQQGCVESLEGSVPLEESMNIRGTSAGDKICLKWEIEDLSILLIHSRKINVRALLAFTAFKEIEKELPLTTDLRKEGISQQKETINVLGLHLHNRDTIRIRDTFTLSSNKPDIDKIVWDCMDVRGVDVRTEEGRVLVKGEIFAFLLYEDTADSEVLQWLEYALPFQKEIPCEGCLQEMIPEMDLTILNTSLAVKPDADGEERLIQVELLMESDLKVYKEGYLELLKDVYHPSCNMKPERESVTVDQLVIKNYAKCRIQEKVQLEDGGRRILQICHSDGTVHIEESRMQENGIMVEGYVQIHILYITGVDEMPFYQAETMVPFSMMIEAPGIDEDCRWYLRGDIEQLSTTMADGSAIDVKALVSLGVLVFRNKKIETICSVNVQELDMEAIKKMPGMVGYVVQKGDTLWSLAKRFYTTVESIREVNQLTQEELCPNDKLIILKEVR